jgi:hypothetical protein
MNYMVTAEVKCDLSDMQNDAVRQNYDSVDSMLTFNVAVPNDYMQNYKPGTKLGHSSHISLTVSDK